MGLQSGGVHVALFLMVLSTFAAAVGALSLCVTVGSSTAGKAALAMNLVLLISLVVGGEWRGGCVAGWVGGWARAAVHPESTAPRSPALALPGVLVNPESIPSWIGWLHWLSLYYYSYAALITNEMATLTLDFVVRAAAPPRTPPPSQR